MEVCRLFVFRWRAVVCLSLAIAVFFAFVPSSTYSHAKVLKVGSRGGDVYDLQGRLAYLGYYKAKIDGHFGWKTYNSVRSFQREFGMKVDGVVGPKTKQKLLNATKNYRAGKSAETKGTGVGPVKFSAFSESEMKVLARAVHGEARGEPYTGQVAVAAVILNRIKSPSFPKTISGVVFQPGAFTAVDDGQIWLEPGKSAYKAARDAINGWDPSGGAIYYFNPVTATSKWIWSRPQIKSIGKHIFAR
jgi:N-acetylmuramoyl-L-alanine amidase